MSSFFYRNLRKTYPVVSQSEGVWLTDTAGNKYLDGCSGAIVVNLGHGLEEVREAITEQLKRCSFAHTSQFVSEPALNLAERLVDMTADEFGKGARAYFTSGGSESVETALKMARAYYVEHGQLERSICISRWHSYHGSTLGALSVTGHPARRRPYLPLLRSAAHINTDYRYRCKCGFGPGPCTSEECVLHRANELEDTILLHGPENVMAFIAEPIVGATLGAAVPGKSYWGRVREICTKYGILLIVDEVMTGLGRTGAKFAIDHWSVAPDLFVLGKGLAAGYQPLGAVLASGNVVAAFETNSGLFEHGFTYSGHPVACAAGVATLDYLNSHQLVDKVAARQEAFFERFEEIKNFDFVGDIRGLGFMLGIEFVRNKQTKEPLNSSLRFNQMVTRQALQHGLLVYPGQGFIDGVNGDHIMIAPPFTISDEELDELVSRLKLALRTVHAEVKSLR